MGMKLSSYLEDKPDLKTLDLGTCVGLASAIQSDEMGRGKEFLNSLYIRIGELYTEIGARVDILEQEKMVAIAEKLGFHVVRLEIGDAACHNVAFERKGVDFLQSVFSERVFQQLHEIKTNYDFGFLVIDRDYEDVLVDAFKHSITEYNVLCTIASFMLRGFPPLFMGSQETVAQLCNIVCVKASDGKDRTAYNPIRRDASKGEYSMMILSNFPSVGPKKAESLLKWFENLRLAEDAFYWLTLIGDDERFAMGLDSINESTCFKCVEVLESKD